MDAETLRRGGTKVLFGEALRTYQREVGKIVGETRAVKDLGDPQTVLDCMAEFSAELSNLYAEWYPVMRKNLSNDDDPDPEPCEDSDVGLHPLTERVQFGYWDAGDDDLVPIEGMTVEEREAAAAKLGITVLLLEALWLLGASVADEVSSDLKSIWRRLDRIEGK